MSRPQCVAPHAALAVDHQAVFHTQLGHPGQDEPSHDAFGESRRLAAKVLPPHEAAVAVPCLLRVDAARHCPACVTKVNCTVSQHAQCGLVAHALAAAGHRG